MSNDILRKRPILGRRVLVPFKRDYDMDSKADAYEAEHGKSIERIRTFESLVLRYKSNVIVFTQTQNGPMTFGIRDAIRKFTYEEVVRMAKGVSFNHRI
jgi:hypothetical protein